MAEKLKDILKTAVDEKKKVELSQMTEAVEAMVSDDKEIGKEISLAGDVVFNMVSDPVMKFRVELKDGKTSLSCDLADDPDFFIEIPFNTLEGIISGKKDVVTPFMGGEISMWKDGMVGNMAKAMDIMPIITVVAEKMELKV